MENIPAYSTDLLNAARSNLPYAFTEHGVLMAACLLTSRRAIEVSIHIIGAYYAMQR
jgi:hypothetical protein